MTAIGKAACRGDTGEKQDVSRKVRESGPKLRYALFAGTEILKRLIPQYAQTLLAEHSLVA